MCRQKESNLVLMDETAMKLVFRVRMIMRPTVNEMGEGKNLGHVVEQQRQPSTDVNVMPNHSVISAALFLLTPSCGWTTRPVRN